MQNLSNESWDSAGDVSMKKQEDTTQEERELVWYWGMSDSEMGYRAISYEPAGSVDPTNRCPTDRELRAISYERRIGRALRRLPSSTIRVLNAVLGTHQVEPQLKDALGRYARLALIRAARSGHELPTVEALLVATVRDKTEKKHIYDAAEKSFKSAMSEYVTARQKADDDWDDCTLTAVKDLIA